jgi:hypothetical protein
VRGGFTRKRLPAPVLGTSPDDAEAHTRPLVTIRGLSRPVTGSVPGHSRRPIQPEPGVGRWLNTVTGGQRRATRDATATETDLIPPGRGIESNGANTSAQRPRSPWRWPVDGTGRWQGQGEVEGAAPDPPNRRSVVPLRGRIVPTQRGGQTSDVISPDRTFPTRLERRSVPSVRRWCRGS